MIPPPLLRRIRLGTVALLATLATLAYVVTTADSVEGTVPAPRRPRRIPFTDVHPYGANFFLEREADAWTQAKTVELAAAGGIRWAKQHFLWSEIEREPGVYEWAKYDHIVSLYRSHGLEVIARLDWAPPWVRPPDDYTPGLNNPPQDVADYARFVGATVAHYRGRVRFYQIWNEPNLLAEWGNDPNRPVDPAQYVDLLSAAATAAREADPDVVILAAPLAINTETVDLAGNMNDLEYLRGMYEAGASTYFDILSANAFGMDRPPEDPPAPGVLNFRRVELQRAVMADYGDVDKPVWFAEYGWNAAPARLGAERLRWQRVTEEQQAAWTVEGVRWAEANWPWAGVFSIWYFRHWEQRPDRADYYFRMVDPDFTPRRVYDAVRRAAAEPVAGPGEWAERSAPVVLVTPDDWRWAWDQSVADRNVLLARRTGAELRFRFHGSAVAVRLRLSPQGGTVLVEVDGRRPGPEAAVSLVGSGEWVWRTVTEGLANGGHVLRLVAVDDGEVAIDGFRVTAGGEPGWRARLLLVLGTLAVGLAALLVADIRRAARRVTL